jgi:indolepyruvate ferredoxin oxidoreductase, beta subunit
VFLTRLIGEIATAEGLNVVSSETHGMAVRGGSINSHLRIGPFSSSLIRQGHADFLLSLDASETANNMHFLKPGGLVIENSPLADEPECRRVDAAGLARGLGRIQLENVVLLGFAASLDGFPITLDTIRLRLGSDPREDVRRMNQAALEAGARGSLQAGNRHNVS